MFANYGKSECDTINNEAFPYSATGAAGLIRKRHAYMGGVSVTFTLQKHSVSSRRRFSYTFKVAGTNAACRHWMSDRAVFHARLWRRIHECFVYFFHTR